MLKIGFILPSSDYLFNPFRGDPFTHFQILTILDDFFGDRINTCLVDLRGIDKRFAIYHIPECDVYLHSVYTLDYEEQLLIVRALRAAYPHSIHIAGGPHANAFPEECLTIFDSLIIGEGEKTIIQAIQGVMCRNLKPTYREESIIDINDYLFWRRDYLPASATARKNMMTLKNRDGFDKFLGTTVIFSRGCPYQCHFCAIRHAGIDIPGIRYRIPEHIEMEIDYLKEAYGIQGISLVDEIGIPLSRNNAIKHLEAIGRTGIFWRGQCRVDGITPEIAMLARESGCVAMGLGVESAIQQCLDIINKKIKVEKSKETIALLKRNNIEARIYLILGLPGEPPDVVEKTWAFIEETNPDLVFLAMFTVRPGTEVYNNPERFGIKKVSTDWKKTMHLQNRYAKEAPTLTFEYSDETPWGKGMPGSVIISNFLELQRMLKERGLNSL